MQDVVKVSVVPDLTSANSVLIGVACDGGLSCTVSALLREDGTIWVGSALFASAREADLARDSRLKNVSDVFHQSVPSLHALVELVRERYKA